MDQPFYHDTRRSSFINHLNWADQGRFFWQDWSILFQVLRGEAELRYIKPSRKYHFFPSLALRSLNALEITETDDSDIAAPARIGLRRVPLIG